MTSISPKSGETPFLHFGLQNVGILTGASIMLLIALYEDALMLWPYSTEHDSNVSEQGKSWQFGKQKTYFSTWTKSYRCMEVIRSLGPG